jgi:peroxiredoxin
MRRLILAAALTMVTAFAAQVPRKAPEFEMQLPGGGKKLLSQYRGKVIALEFLYTTCPHCQHASQVMNKLQAEYGPKGFQAIGVAFNPFAGMLVGDFIRDFGGTYPIGFSERDKVHAFLGNDPNYALHVPQMVFIDRDGNIRQQSQAQGDTTTASEVNMRLTIEKLLKEPAGTKPAKARRSLLKSN